MLHAQCHAAESQPLDSKQILEAKVQQNYDPYISDNLMCEIITDAHMGSCLYVTVCGAGQISKWGIIHKQGWSEGPGQA